MQTAKSRRGRGWAIAASIVVHAVALVVVWLQRPTLPLPVWEGGPPEPIIPILIVPKPPPQAGRQAQPAPIRLHRRPQPFIPPDVTPAPIAPPAAKPEAAAPPAPKSTPAFHPAPQPEGPKGDVKTTLRQSFVGCANADTVGLNRAEQDLCDEKFGKGAKTTAFVGLGLAADKQKLLDEAGARKELEYRLKRAAPAPLTPSASPGASAEQQADALGVPPKR